MDMQATFGDKHDAIANRIEQVATALARHYEGDIPRDDLLQEMWMALFDRIDDEAFLAQPVNAIVNMLAWRAKDYARRQFRYTNPLPHGPRTPQADHDEWEFIAVNLTVADTTDDSDDRLTAAQLIDRLMDALADRPKTMRVARSILEGRSKVETARYLGLAPSTVAGHIAIMRTMVESLMA